MLAQTSVGEVIWDHLVEVLFARFLCYKVSIFPFIIDM